MWSNGTAIWPWRIDRDGWKDITHDYTNPLFINADNTSRIYGIWDQTTNQRFTKEDIDRAIQSQSPYEVVSQRDTNGHGTYIAGLACGNVADENDFYGMAPLSYIGVVKLKDAKTYLKEYYGVTCEDLAKEQVCFANATSLVAEEEDITLSLEEYDELLAAQSANFGYESPEDYEAAYEEAYGEGSLKEYFLQEKVVQWLVDNSVKVE